MNYCGWIVCPYNSEHDKDFDLTDGYCKQDREYCELRDNPREALKKILKESEAKQDEGDS